MCWSNGKCYIVCIYGCRIRLSNDSFSFCWGAISFIGHFRLTYTRTDTRETGDVDSWWVILYLCVVLNTKLWLFTLFDMWRRCVGETRLFCNSFILFTSFYSYSIHDMIEDWFDHSTSSRLVDPPSIILHVRLFLDPTMLYWRRKCGIFAGTPLKICH